MIKICPSNKSQIFIKYSCGWFIKLVKILTVRQGQTLLAKECPNFEYMKNLRSSPSEHFLVIMVCQKRQKCKNSEKPGFLRELWLYLQNGKVNFYEFLAHNTFDHKQKKGKFFFSKFLSIFEKTSTLQKLKFLKN